MKLIFRQHNNHVICISGNVHRRSSYPKQGIVLLMAARRRSDDIHRRTCDKYRPCDSNLKAVSEASESKGLSFVGSRMKDFFSYTIGRTALTKIHHDVKCLAGENARVHGLRKYNLKMKSTEQTSAA